MTGRGLTEIVLPAWVLELIAGLAVLPRSELGRFTASEAYRACRGAPAMWTADGLELVLALLAHAEDLPADQTPAASARALVEAAAADLDPRMRECIPLRAWSADRDGGQPQPAHRSGTLPPSQAGDPHRPRRQDDSHI
jgi:hypothetical protein